MATDPNLTTEQKKRLRDARRLERDLQSPLTRAYRNAVSMEDGYHDYVDRGVRGVGQDIGVIAADAITTGAKALGAIPAALYYGAEGPPPAPPASLPAASAARIASARETAAMQQQGRDADVIRRDPGQFGLTRIYKSKDAAGNSVYTNLPGEPGDGSEVRYYNQYGNREGVDPRAIPTTDAAGRRVDTLLRDPAASDANLLVAAGGGRKSLAWQERVGEEIAARKAQAELDALDPAQRVQMMVAGMREQGEERRSLRRANIDGARLDLDAQRYQFDMGEKNAARAEALRNEMIANPQAGMAKLRGVLKNMNADERMAHLSDPDSEVGGLVRTLLRDQLAEASGDRNLDLAALKKSPWYRRGDFTTGGFPGFATPVDLDDLGISDDEFQVLLDAELDTMIRSRARTGQ